MSEQTVIDVERRLAKVEWTVESHADELAEIRKHNMSIDNRLEVIEKSMMRVQWIALGAALVYFSEQVGLGQFFKLLAL